MVWLGWLILVVALSIRVAGFPSSTVPAAGQYVSLKRRSVHARNDTQWAQWAQSQRNAVIAKYGLRSNTKRATGDSLIVNQDYDSSFYGTLAVGTPPYFFDVFLDTGSADLWVASSRCQSTCAGTGNFDAAKSSTFKSLDRDFNVTYGNGEVMGTLVQDVVQMAGFSVANQQFGSVTSTSTDFLQNPVTGLIGLAWQSLSTSGAMPFWQTLAKDLWSMPVMAFQLSRYINDTQAGGLEPGGSLTMGYVNHSLYSGLIDYRDIPNGEPSYWLQEITSLTVRGKLVSLPTGASYAAIDTGTTLVAGPAEGIAAIYAQIPGSSPGTGVWEGFYSYPCAQKVTVEISFGGPSWAISPADFQFQASSTSGYCYGAFYSAPTSPSAPQWIIGDTFLKNVYAVFRYDPPSVGFATLSDVALAMNGVNALIPSATLGTDVASVTARAPRSRTPSMMMMVSFMFLAAFMHG